MIFIVRDDRPCDFLFQCSDLTWSAYNRWPADYSIYTPHEKGHTSIGVPSGTVSFDRPYGLFTHPVNKLKKSGGSGEYLPWEFPLAFWMEKEGYGVSYISNIDTHSDPQGLLRTKGFVSVGHDEYWTIDMYDNVRKARDEGVNLAFFGGNSVLCVVPLLPNATGTANRATRREGWFMPVQDEIPEAVKRRLLNRRNFEMNMGPDGGAVDGRTFGQGSKDRSGNGMWRLDLCHAGALAFRGYGNEERRLNQRSCRMGVARGTCHGPPSYERCRTRRCHHQRKECGPIQCDSLRRAQEQRGLQCGHHLVGQRIVQSSRTC